VAEGRKKESVISLSGVTLAYRDGPPVLNGVDLAVHEGERLGIVGRSGCGKSTLLSVLSGISPARTGGSFSGSGSVAGMELPLTPRAASSSVGMVFQDPESLFVEGKVIDEVSLGARWHGMEGAELSLWCKEVMSALRIQHLADRRTRDLSGGQKQLVALASALVMGPDVLLLDEPTSQLDPMGRRLFERGLNGLRSAKDVTIVQVEHRHETLLGCDRIAVMGQGVVLGDGPAVKVLSDRELLGRAGLEVTALLEAFSRTSPGYGDGPVTVAQVVRMLRRDGIRMDEGVPVIGRDLPPTRMSGVHFTYPGGVRALRGIDLDLSGPGPVCIMGPNGSGKSTLASVLSGSVRPTSGNVEGEGRVFHLYQRPSNLLFEETVRAELRASPRDVPPDAINHLGLDRMLDCDPLLISAGERQRLALAKALGSGADIAVLDEPFKGMDPEWVRTSLDIIGGPNFPPGVLITNDPGIASVCPRLVIVRNGRVLADGRPGDLLSSDRTMVRLGWPMEPRYLIERPTKKDGTRRSGVVT